MTRTNRMITYTLLAGLFHLLLLDAGWRLRAENISHPNLLRRQVEQFGAGAELKLKLNDGEKLRGAVQTIGDETFVLALKRDNTLREIEYDDLKKVRYAKRGYKADGHPDPVEARRMVMALGVGKHIMVKVPPKRKIRGHIQQIGQDHFTVLPDGQTHPVQVPYSDVLKVNQNLTVGATIAILAGIAAAVFVTILILDKEDEVGLSR